MPAAKIRVIPDSNVLIAAALNKGGYCHSWVFGAGEPYISYVLFTSEAILQELAAKLQQRFHFSQAETVRYLRQLDQVLGKVRPSLPITAVRDPKDNMVLECAVEANAQLIITFDKDLLNLKQFDHIKIDHPRMTKYWFKQ